MTDPKPSIPAYIKIPVAEIIKDLQRRSEVTEKAITRIHEKEDAREKRSSRNFKLGLWILGIIVGVAGAGMTGYFDIAANTRAHNANRNAMDLHKDGHVTKDRIRKIEDDIQACKESITALQALHPRRRTK